MPTNKTDSVSPTTWIYLTIVGLLIIARVAYQPYMVKQLIQEEEGEILGEISIPNPFIGKEIIEGRDTIIKLVRNPDY